MVSRTYLRRLAALGVVTAFAVFMGSITGCGTSGAGSPPNVSVSSAAPTTAVNASPSPAAFGNVAVGTISTLTVTLLNNGSSNISVSALSVAGPGFNIANAPATPFAIASGGNMPLSVTFSPTSSGAVSGAVTVTSNASTPQTTVALTGTGVTNTGVSLNVAPTSLPFGTVSVGGTSTMSVTATNTGQSTVTIPTGGITFTGTGFSLGNLALPVTIAVGGNAVIPIVFTPAASGAVTGSATIVSNAANSPAVISLSGTGTTAPTPSLAVNSSSVSFGNVAVGVNSTMNVTLSNSGTAAAAVSAINFSGPFSLGSLAVPFNLATNANVSIPLVFTPTATGNATGSASIVSNAPNSPLIIKLSGSSSLAHSVDLSWNASTTPAVTYAVFRSTQAGGENPQSPLASNLPSTTFTDSTVQSGQTYFYVIVAVDGSGTASAFSNEATAQIPTP